MEIFIVNLINGGIITKFKIFPITDKKVRKKVETFCMNLIVENDGILKDSNLSFTDLFKDDIYFDHFFSIQILKIECKIDTRLKPSIKKNN